MKLGEIVDVVADEHDVKAKMARQIIMTSFKTVMEEIAAGRNVNIPGVCIIRSKERKAPAAETGQKPVAGTRFGQMLPVPAKKTGLKK